MCVWGGGGKSARNSKKDVGQITLEKDGLRRIRGEGQLERVGEEKSLRWRRYEARKERG